jgi:hypothetical protein
MLIWWNDAYPVGPSVACYIGREEPLRGYTRGIRIRLVYYTIHRIHTILHTPTPPPLKLKLERDLDYG